MPICVFSQKYSISGYIREKRTGEDLIGATIIVKEIQKGTISNQYGFYSISLTEGDYTIKVSYIGYQDFEQKIKLNKDISINISLESSSILTKEVVVKGERSDRNIESIDIGMVQLPVEQIKSLPAFLGEVDILKTIQLLPGVQSAGEGNTGFYVRGGGPDQNLIILDDAVVYNAGHLFGFFSVFNADAVKDINLIKGGMPSQYGGRLSSVLDITMNEGNNKNYEYEGGIGVISSRMTVQGPIKKDTSSFIISGRRTYIDVLTKPFINENLRGTGYYFYDLNTKLNYRFSDKNRLFLSGYFGRDVFSFKNASDGFYIKIPWGNATGSMRWNHLFSNKLFLNTTATFSDYRFDFQAEQEDFEFIMMSGVQDYSLKSDFTWYPNVLHTVRFGVQYMYHIFTPSSATARIGETIFDSGEIIKYHAHDAAIYINDEFDITEKLKISIGLRGSLFSHIGPFTRYIKDDMGRKQDTIQYAPGKPLATYQNVEPRFSMRYIINRSTSLKAAYTQNYQYIHLASLSSSMLPTDIWMPCTELIKPQFSVQYSAGIFKNFLNNNFETSIELYYKDMKNLIEYKEGATSDEDVGDNPDNNFTFGTGYSYGAEFFVKKRYGKTTGWIGYTWSRTNRLFEEINLGIEFPAKYDRRHDLSFVASHDFNDQWQASAIFVYATGNATTLPIGRYFIDGRIVNEYGSRNGYRMAPYHRADMSITYKPKSKGNYQSSWNFAVYNLYNRYNPYFIYFDSEIDFTNFQIETKAKQVSLFSILPSITYNFKF